MNCANHPDTPNTAYCRTCGKPLCSDCTRDVQGVIYCETCLGQKMHGAAAGVPGFAPGVIPPIPASAPNPALAGVLAGFFPFGVGAVYTGQYAKGLAHLVIFTGLVWGENVVHNGALNMVLGLGIAFFYVYQIIDAVRSAHAVRLGQPVPDPFGLSRMFGSGGGFRPETTVPYASATGATYSAPAPGVYQVPAYDNRSKMPTGAIVLIALGCLFLLHTAGVFNLEFDRIWPLFLIALGGWLLFVRCAQPATRIGRDGRLCRRRIVGPAVLITVGVLSAIENFNGPGWDRTWPLLLLVLGGVKLLEATGPVATPAFPSAAMPVAPAPPPAAPFPDAPSASMVYQPEVFPSNAPPISGSASSGEVKNG